MAFIPYNVSKKHYEITKIIDETHDMKSYYLKPADGSPIFDYRPGHFVNCTIVGKEDIGRRSFSIGSAPGEEELFISVKLVGAFTHALFEMNVGGLIEVLGPLGLPYVREEDDMSDIVMISGGSGVVPFRSLIKYNILNHKKNRMFMLLSNKTLGDVCYREEFNEFMKNSEQLLIKNFITRESIEQNEFFTKGRMNEEYLRRILIEPEKKLYFLCGPKGLITASVEQLTKIGVPMSRIKAESWGN